MEDFILPLMFVGFIALAGVTMVWFIRAERKRTESLRMMAESMGLVYQTDLSPSLREKLDRLALMNKGRARKVRNVLVADTGAAVMTIFDYQYTTGGGNNSQTHRLTVVAMESDGLRVPSFQMWPEGFWSRVGSMFGMQDIDFDDSPEFSEAYVLKGEEEAAVRECFTPERRQFFAENQGHKLEAAEGVLVVFDSRKKVDELTPLMDAAVRVRGVLEDGDRE